MTVSRKKRKHDDTLNSGQLSQGSGVSQKVQVSFFIAKQLQISKEKVSTGS